VTAHGAVSWSIYLSFKAGKPILKTFVVRPGVRPAVAGLVARLQDEEAGYEEYRRKVRYRLVPGVW
jgi:hypothetical protein